LDRACEAASYTGGLSRQDDQANLPPHNAGARSAFEIVNFLLDKHLEGIRTRNGDGQLAVHRALEADHTQLMRRLIDSYPESVNITDHFGRLRLHTACSAKALHDIILLLLDRYAGDERSHCGLSVIDIHGQLPLHCFCSFP